ncbi:MAG: hypothetical protein ACK5JJ_00250 [Cyanobacteriota bacterium]
MLRLKPIVQVQQKGVSKPVYRHAKLATCQIRSFKRYWTQKLETSAKLGRETSSGTDKALETIAAFATDTAPTLPGNGATVPSSSGEGVHEV